MYKRRGPARDPDRSLFHPGEAAEYWDPSITHRQVQAAADAEKQAEDEAQAGEPTRRLPLPADWVGEGLWPGQALDGAAHKYVAVLSRRAGPGEGGRPPGQRAEGVYEVGSVVSSSGGSNLDVVFLGCPCHTKMESVPWNYIYHISPPPSVTQLYDPVTVGKWFALALLHGVRQGKAHLMLPRPLITAIASWATKFLLIPIRFYLSKIGRDTRLSSRLIQIAAMEAEWPHWRDWASCSWTLYPTAFPTMNEVSDFIISTIVPNFHFSYVHSQHFLLQSQHAVNVTTNGLDPLILYNYYTACISGAPLLASPISGLFSSHAVCFGPQSTVIINRNGRKHVQKVCDVRVGDQVSTGSQELPFTTVSCIWMCIVTRPTPIYSLQQCDGTLLQITLDHPIYNHSKWCLPSANTLTSSLNPQTLPEKTYLWPGCCLFNFVLQGPCRSLSVGGITCCTLGMPVPGHEEPFWGSYKVIQWLKSCPRFPNVLSVNFGDVPQRTDFKKKR